MTSEDLDLDALAQNGTMDNNRWPGLLDRLLPRLSSIAYNDFPAPPLPLPTSLTPPADDDVSVPGQETITKDESNDTEPKLDAQTTEAARPNTASHTQVDSNQDTPMSDQPRGTKRERDTTSQSPPVSKIKPSATNLETPPGTLPPQLLTLLQTIQSTLRNSFSTAPPHTAQRLAELILRPKQHYRTLPSYLRALDRIVSVISPTTAFPIPLPAPNPLLNGRLINGASPSPDLTGRDSLGGAELTEIPWLRVAGSPTPGLNGPTSDLRTESTSLIDGPNGAGSIETVTVNVNGVSSSAGSASDPNAVPQYGISQGELLRQEQEAGIITVPSAVPNGRVTRSSAAASAAANRAVGANGSSVGGSGDALGDLATDAEETVHVRGPNVIGMEDMGPQAPGSGLEGGLDVEGALGRRGEGESIVHAVGRDDMKMERTTEEDLAKEDDEGGTIIVDADGVVESEGGVGGLARQEKVPPAVDHSTS